jgi:YD repeat-containing protein
MTYYNMSEAFASCGCTDNGNSNNCNVGVWTDAQCYCAPGLDWDSGSHSCLPIRDIFIQPPPCTDCGRAGLSSNPGQGNPIYPLVGNKRETIDTGLSLGGKPLKFTYDSVRAPWTYQTPGLDPYPSEYMPEGVLGQLWFSSMHSQLGMNTNGQSFHASRGDGRLISFNAVYAQGTNAQSWVADSDQWDTFFGSNYAYHDQTELGLEMYSYANGANGSPPASLLEWTSATGLSLTPAYSTSSTPANVAPGPGYLLSLTDPFGRSVSFTYATLANAAVGISTITDANQRTINVGYDGAGNLASLTWQDQTSTSLVYDSPNPNQAWALTGVVDESNVRYASFAYDPAGWAQSTQLSGGVNSYVASYTTPPQPTTTLWTDTVNKVIWRYHSWPVPNGATLLQPDGTTLSMSTSNAPIQAAQGSPPGLTAPRSTGISQPAVPSTGSPAATSLITYDANGLVASRDDFDGHRACYVNDATSKFETLRVEGLPGGTGGTACSSVTAPATAAIPTGSRKTSTVWHPQWRLPVQVAEPGKITTYSYNGQSGASCAPSSALLPDGSAIAVLCARTEKATTDTDGHLGATATLDASVPARTWSYTYNQYGQVLTATSPNGGVSTYAYYPSTAFTGADPNAVGHTMGDLQTLTTSVSAGLGITTTYTSYNKAGQLLESQDANGVLSDFTYDPRGRMLTASIGGQTTSYAYFPTGLLKKVTQPDGVSFIQYGYDPAHRLTSVSDNLGNSITYTLDNLGNRTLEQTTDPSGALARSLSRSIDALGRVQQTTGLQ